MRIYYLILICFLGHTIYAQQLAVGELLYTNALASDTDLRGWQMEGPGMVEHKGGWMQLYSPEQKGHHVLWCPIDFPADFIAEWQVQNSHTDAGLCIVFFSARSNNGESIFTPSLPKRNGDFKDYIKGAIRNYHISYYANAKGEKGRETANLRKNPGFHLVQKGEAGIPITSTSVHTVRLSKQTGHITLLIDERKVIDWQDTGAAWQAGKIGFRQMKWTRFAYRNFKVWAIKP